MHEERKVDWERVRADFPGVHGAGAYLNTASMGLPPRSVTDAVREVLSSWESGSASWRAFEDRAEEARALFARLVGVRARNVAFLNSASAAASQVAERLPSPPEGGRATIVVGADEFRSNLFPWWNQERRGFRIRRVPFRDGGPRLEDLVAGLDEDTALIAVSHVQSATGHRVDLEALAAACRACGALLFVDGTQSVGACPLPPELRGVDFLAAAAYKWLLSPRGAAFLVVADEHLGTLAPLQPSWKTPSQPYGDYYGGPFELAEAAATLDVSLPWPVWVGTARALEVLLEVGPERIQERASELAASFRAGLPALGLAPLFGEDESSPIVALRLPDPEGAKSSLARYGVVAAVRAEYLRTSFHFYNSEADVERVLAALRG